MSAVYANANQVIGTSILLLNLFITITGSEEVAQCTLTNMLRMSIKVANIYCFLCDQEKQLQARTVINYSSALQWHLIYLWYLLHRDTIAKGETEEQIQKGLCSWWVCPNTSNLILIPDFSVEREHAQHEVEMKESSCLPFCAFSTLFHEFT